MKASALLTTTLLAAIALASACGPPDPVIVKAGQTCHVSDEGWKNCDGACFSDERLKELDHQRNPEKAPKAPESPTITTTTGSVNKADYDCHGILNDKCVLKGTCVAKVGLNEPCVGNKMCSEGQCMGIDKDAKGNLVWRCTIKK